MADQNHIRIPIHATVEGIGEYNDALFVTQSEFDALSGDQIDSMKQSRVDAWANEVRAARIRNSDPAVIAARLAEEAAARRAEILSRLMYPDEATEGLLAAVVSIYATQTVTNRDELVAALKAKMGAI